MIDIQKAESSKHSSADIVDPRIPIYLITGDEEAKAAVISGIVIDPSYEENFAVALMDHMIWREASREAEKFSNHPVLFRMASGCICIDATSDPINALYQLHLRKLGLQQPELNYEAVVIEVGRGIDTGAFVAVVQNDNRLELTYRISGIIHAVDTRCRPFSIDENRIGEADTIVLTHLKDSEPDTSQAVSDVVTTLNPFAVVVRQEDLRVGVPCPWRVPLGQFNDDDASSIFRSSGMVFISGEGIDYNAVASNIFCNPHSNQPQVQPPIRALRFYLPGEVDMATIIQTVVRLCSTYQDNILRLSGVINVKHAEYPISLDVVAGCFFLPAYHSNCIISGSDICLVARGIDIEGTLNAFRRCAWDDVAMHTRINASV